jgi:protein TonB
MPLEEQLVFDTLIESKAKRQRSTGQAIASLVVHGVLIFGAAKAAAGVAQNLADKPRDTAMVFIKPPPPPPPPKVEAPPPDAVVSKNPPPKGFQTLVPPDVIPKEIPPVDLTQKAFNPADFTGKGVEGGIASGVVGGTGPVEVKGEVFLEAQLDDPVQPVSQSPPRYPPAMQAAGIEGRVELQYIVDTLGRVEPPSIKILRSTNKMFEEPAREAILKSVFKPAKFKGTPVRQLVQQALGFRLGR